MLLGQSMRGLTVSPYIIDGADSEIRTRITGVEVQVLAVSRYPHDGLTITPAPQVFIVRSKELACDGFRQVPNLLYSIRGLRTERRYRQT